jgi:WD40 repeat protein
MSGPRSFSIAVLCLAWGAPAWSADPPAKANAPRPFQFGSTDFRHPKGILDAILSPDGKLLATVCFWHVRVFDVETGACLHHFPDCGVPRYSTSQDLARVAFSPDSRLLAHALNDTAAARVWDVRTGREVGKFGTNPPAASNRSPQTWVQFTPDGAEIRVLRTEGIESLRTDRPGPPPVPIGLPAPRVAYDFDIFDLFALDPAGRLAAGHGRSRVGGGQGTFVVLDAGTGKTVTRLAVTAERAGFGPGAKTIATLDKERLVVWDVATGKELGAVPRPPAADPDGDLRTDPAFSPDGSIVYLGCLSGAIRRYDWRAGKELPALRGHLWWVRKVIPLADGKRVLSAGYDGTVRRWDVATGKEIPLPAGYTGTLSRAVIPPGDRVVLGDWGGRIDVWDARGATILRTLATAGAPVGAVAVSPADGAVATFHWDGLVRVWDPAAGKEARSFGVRPAFTDNPRCFRFAPDGAYLYLSTDYLSIQAFDHRTGHPAWPAPVTRAYQFAVAPDGRTVAYTRHGEAAVHVMNPAAPAGAVAIPVGEERGRGWYTECHSLAFLPDGRLAGGFGDGTVRLFDLRERAEKTVFRAGETVYRVYPAPEGDWLVTRRAGGWAIWDLPTGRIVDSFPDLPARLKANGADPADWPDNPDLLPADWAARLRPSAAGDGLKGEAAWKALAGEDGRAAYRAMCGLLADPGTPRLLRTHLTPAVEVPADRLANLIGRLDAPRFADREAATQSLSALGLLARPAVTAALAKGPSAEARERMEKLLDGPLAGTTPADVRITRAVQALEGAGTPDARAVLAEWARGARGPTLTEAARRAVERLERADRADR